MKKILVVDDSATSRAIFKASVPKGEYEVIEASDAEMALQLATTQSPDICVMDYNLPDITGIDIAANIMSEHVQVDFILMTANMQDSIVDRAKELGFKAFIEKPISPEKIMNALKELG